MRVIRELASCLHEPHGITKKKLSKPFLDHEIKNRKEQLHGNLPYMLRAACYYSDIQLYK